MYEKSKEAFSEELFENPTREYRGAPFWSWNGKLNQERLEEQIRVFKKMGFGGFHVHARIGLETEYLGEEFMSLVKHCNSYGNELGLNTYLYDEDKWPSGAGGGRVTCDNRFAARYLLFSPTEYPEAFLDRNLAPTSRHSKNGELKLLKRYDVELEKGRLKSYRVLNDGETGSNTWYAYLVITEKLSWFNNQPYVDVFNKKAIEKFIEVTHERYYKELGDQFSKTIPSIFTDEPGFPMQEELRQADVPQDVGIGYTEDMEQFYKERFGESLLEHLPEIFWNLADGTISYVRYQYNDCCAQMFSEGYSRTISNWCKAHNILMTGHVMFEPELESQSKIVGEVMRVLDPFTMPGIDMLADRHEYTTAKQAESVSHQNGCEGVMSELYGVTNWDYDFRGHKHQGDWMAALGVTLRVPHLAWMSMRGESKRDYPAPLDEHSTWYEKYNIIENYFARVNTALTRGKPICKVGVIHPIESIYMALGPKNETAQLRERLDGHFDDITEWLMFGFHDFDYISEALLPGKYTVSEDMMLHVGKMEYSVIILPDMLTIKTSTLQILKKFHDAGGKVIFMGQVPSYVDGKVSDEAIRFANTCCVIDFDRTRLYEELQDYRELDVINSRSFLRADRLISQMREDGNEKWLFLAHGKHDDRLELSHWVSVTGREDMSVCVKGIYSVKLYDAMTGSVKDMPAYHKNGWTYFMYGMYEQDSLLVRLTPTKNVVDFVQKNKEIPANSEQYLPSVVDYRLSEPNIAVLDQAEYCLDGKEWHTLEEVLRIDNIMREELGCQLRTMSFPQPWLEPNKELSHIAELKFSVESRIDADNVDLAIETTPGMTIMWNGEDISVSGNEYYLDAQIRRFHLGTIKKGINELYVKTPFGNAGNIEACYLLGDFGVTTLGNRAIIVDKPDTVCFGDLSRQPFAFYGGNMTYICDINTAEGTVEIEVPEYYAALLTISLDGQQKDVYADPYTVRFDNVTEGMHKLEITAYGTRINTFGQLHNCRRKERYYGPKTWRTTGKDWTYAYQLKQTGITLPPIVRFYNK